MARYQKRISQVDVVGTIWMPAITAATTYTLSDYDIGNIRARSQGADVGPVDSGPVTREGVEEWLSRNSGDFQSVEDFRVTISTADGYDFDSDFEDEESELTFNDCMFPSDDD